MSFLLGEAADDEAAPAAGAKNELKISPIIQIKGYDKLDCFLLALLEVVILASI